MVFVVVVLWFLGKGVGRRKYIFSSVLSPVYEGLEGTIIFNVLL